jgi:glycosyltransferase involved in cell wall biosynthesis
MKVLHINTYDRGGAAHSAIRLHLGLLGQGIKSKMLFLKKSQSTVPNSFYFEPSYLRTFLYKSNIKKRKSIINAEQIKDRDLSYEGFTLEGTDFEELSSHYLIEEADVINLHWVSGFVDYPTFFKKIRKPIFWTLHDMNPFTGGCHYSWHCDLYQKGCNSCFQLPPQKKNIVAKKCLEGKIKSLSDIQEIKIVTPSKWLSECSKKSMLFHSLEHFVIPYGLDTEEFKFIENSREKLGLPKEKVVFLFVSQFIQNIRKGYNLILETEHLIREEMDIVICTVGEKSGNKNWFEFGTTVDKEILSTLYSAADAFILPSFEDNFPNTVLEAICCGTPVVALNTGGIPDMVVDGFNGVISLSKTSRGLVDAMRRFIKNRENFDRTAIRKDAIERFDLSIQAKSYVQLYRGYVS